MTNQLVSEISIFAERFSVPVGHAHILPSVFDKVAQIAELPVREIVAQATYTNHPLALYICEVVQEVAASIG